MTSPVHPPDCMDVWILAGQSNMQGYARLPSPPETAPEVWNFSMAGRWETATDPLHRLWESPHPVHSRFMRSAGMAPLHLTNAQMAEQENRTRVIGAGLGIPFARHYSMLTGRMVGLVPCAHGGTSLELWSPSLKAQGTDSLYGALLESVRRCGRPVTGVLWYQGESDCTPELHATYASRLDNFISSLRDDLRLPTLPFVAVQPGRVVDEPFNRPCPEWDVVREAVRTLPIRMPRTAATSAIDLPLDDPIHLNRVAFARLGTRLARLAHALVAGNPCPNPRLMEVSVSSVPPAQTDWLLKFDLAGSSWRQGQDYRGFLVHRGDGTPHPSLHVVNAQVDRQSPCTLRLRLSQTPLEPLLLSYGTGKNPCCTLSTIDDTPLPAFAPLPMPGSPGEHGVPISEATTRHE